MELCDYRARWQKKPVIRAIYHDFYNMILSSCTDGRTLEIGGGSGNFKEMIRDLVSIDIQHTPWLDVIADAQQLPFADMIFDNIIMVDVLHHIQYPVNFFSEALRVLNVGGRIVAMEPAITPFSGVFYRLFHEEPVNMVQNPLCEGVPNSSKDPFDANQAIPTLMFGKYLKDFVLMFPQIRVVDIRFKSLISYPLSGGFKSWSLMPLKLLSLVLKIEDLLLPKIGRFMAFRQLIVLEKVRSLN